MDGLNSTGAPVRHYAQRVARGQLAALASSASAALAASVSAGTPLVQAHPLAALGRPTPAAEQGRGTTLDAAA
jgi:hypothetical protein